MTQKERILNHLKEYGSITPLQALSLYGVYRLSSCINRLKRKDGHKIVTRKTEGVNQYGEPTQYAEYVYVDWFKREAS